MSELDEREMKFALGILEGLSQSAAYRRAGYLAKSDKVACAGGSKLAKRPKIKQYIDASRRADAAKSQATRQTKLEVLSRVITCEDAPINVRIKAIEVHNVMTGDNAPQAVNVFGLSDLLGLIRAGK